MNLLEVVGTLGMVLLLLLTGLETDLRLLRNLGRAALVASAMGMLVPFATGFGLGMVMPDAYLAEPGRRVLFSAFLATAMAISAMPVIAKILMDLDLTRRNVGLVILSAGVVDDTAGWLVLSLIAGAATQGGSLKLGGLALTVLLLFAFLAVAAIVIYPLMRLLVRVVATRVRTPDTDLVLIVALTFLCAAFTELIGVHAVFGAFICGTLLRQVPHLEPETVHRLESFVFSILAPVFFGIVGLKVNLWTLSGGGGTMLAIVLGIACFGKFMGCTLGSLWGGLQFWEALSIAVAMNARGAMELVVATIGLSLGILNPQMFSIIVVVAIVTSFMAPLGLRLTMRMVKITDEEARRLLLEASKGVFDPRRLRLLIPTAAGPNAIEAVRLGLALAKKSEAAPDVIFVRAETGFWRRMVQSRKAQAGQNLDAHIEQIKQLADGGPSPRIRTVVNRSVPQAILSEAKQGIDLVLIGASGPGAMLGGPVLEEVVVGVPATSRLCVRAARVVAHTRTCSYRSMAAQWPASLRSLRCAMQKPPGRGCHWPCWSERRTTAPGQTEPEDVQRPSTRPPASQPPQAHRLAPRRRPAAGRVPGATVRRQSLPAGRNGDLARCAPAHPRFHADLRANPSEALDQELAGVSPAFRASELRPRILRFAYDPRHSALVDEIARGGYDLVVLGAENRAIQHKLFFGYEAQRIIARTSVSLVVVVPNVARLH